MTGLSLWPALAEAVSVWPSWAVPVISGVVTVGAASSTAEVAALVGRDGDAVLVGGGGHHLDLVALVALLDPIGGAGGPIGLVKPSAELNH